MRKRFFLLGFVLFPPAISFAEDLDWSLFNTRVDEAEIIFQGTVISKQYRDSARDYGGVFTIYSFDVHEEFKGESPDGTLVLRTLGGAFKAGNSIVMVSHMPSFSLKGEYLVFLEAFDKGTFVLSGGIFRIELGPISGNPALLAMSGRQVVDFDDDGPVLGEGRIAPLDQTDSDLGLYTAEDGLEIGTIKDPGDEVVVDIDWLYGRLKQQVINRRTEKTYIPGSRVDHAPFN
ncbi:MAG: hypothetical protein O7D88_00920 [Gammaproteobacteria bacterium]|nr:hypothetical protein [Gammaproteobacteria bacterium]